MGPNTPHRSRAAGRCTCVQSEAVGVLRVGIRTRPAAGIPPEKPSLGQCTRTASLCSTRCQVAPSSSLTQPSQV